MKIEAYSNCGHATRINKPKLIAVHAMGEFVDGLHAVDHLKKDGTSAHVLVAPNGDYWLTRRENQVAWHAQGFNFDSLGIECLVQGDYNYSTFLKRIKTPWVREVQLLVAMRIVAEWRARYQIPLIRVKRHSDLSPGRKFDPGEGFPWEIFQQGIRSDLDGVSLTTVNGVVTLAGQ